MSDFVECPYCEYENDMTDGLVDLPGDQKFDHECENCEREFEVEVEFEPSYSGIKIEYKECGKCGKDSRDTVYKGRIYPFPKSLEGLTVCMPCFHEAHREEREKNRQQSGHKFD